jgi:sulfoxide reductase heme-binding subunit YedZ
MAFLCEKSGAWCPEKVVAFIGALLPIFWLAGRVWMADLGPRPVTEAIHFAGFWTVRLLWITLAVTPASRIFKSPRLLLARRILGVAAFAYALFHLSLYIVDQKFDLATVVSEIAMRIYLTIGFVAIVGLITLAATSTDGMVRRLGGRRWITLHRAVYVIAVLGQIHFILQAKNDVYEPMLMLGFLTWLFGWRLLHKFGGEVTALRLVGLAVAAAAATALVETGWYAFMTGVNAWRIFLANFDFAYVIRPAWWVLFAGLGVAAAGWGWRLLRPNQRPTVRRTSSRAVSGRAQTQSAN